mmetsp:Transcript_3471/g.7777  ORF Transcript_3471/g.7777 Transcript_3471/m.7777 type:complete len:316 (+) Transcript_3471:555-1502(+)
MYWASGCMVDGRFDRAILTVASSDRMPSSSSPSSSPSSSARMVEFPDASSSSSSSSFVVVPPSDDATSDDSPSGRSEEPSFVPPGVSSSGVSSSLPTPPRTLVAPSSFPPTTGRTMPEGVGSDFDDAPSSSTSSTTSLSMPPLVAAVGDVADHATALLSSVAALSTGAGVGAIVVGARVVARTTVSAGRGKITPTVAIAVVVGSDPNFNPSSSFSSALAAEEEEATVSEGNGSNPVSVEAVGDALRSSMSMITYGAGLGGSIPVDPTANDHPSSSDVGLHVIAPTDPQYPGVGAGVYSARTTPAFTCESSSPGER